MSGTEVQIAQSLMLETLAAAISFRQIRMMLRLAKHEPWLCKHIVTAATFMLGYRQREAAFWILMASKLQGIEIEAERLGLLRGMRKSKPMCM